MRIALLQIPLDAQSRANNTQSVLRNIDRVAQAAPAPDLLILPGACDTGGVRRPQSHRSRTIECFREGLAYKARDWGIYIAAGMHRIDGEDALTPVSVLFDPDGDVVAQTTARADALATQSYRAVSCWPTAIGRLGICDPEGFKETQRTARDAVKDALVSLPLPRLTTAAERRRAQVIAEAFAGNAPDQKNSWWAVVAPADAGVRRAKAPGVRSFVSAPDGSLVAKAESMEETVLYAEVSLPPAVFPAPTAPVEHQDHAD
jgi:predicted amidohydrolase